MYFSLQEYETRLAKTRQAMDAQGVALLFITDPSNMTWLTGYDEIGRASRRERV